MNALMRDDWKYLGGAVGIHLLLAAVLIGFNLTSHQAIVPQLAIKAVMVDRNTLNQLAHKSAPQAVEEIKEDQPEVEQQREEQERLKQEALQQVQMKQKEQRVLEQKRLRAEAEKQKQLVQQRKAAEAEQKKQQQEAEKKRIADAQQKKKEAEMKRQADAEAKAQKEREAELRAQMADEEGRASAVNAGLLNQYVALIQQKVMRNWNKPTTAKSGLECEVKVTQASGGTVLSVAIGRCNGDQAVRTSIETAVQAASPLPAPPDARLFERNLLFIFKPVE